jgi:hypothetical protein
MSEVNSVNVSKDNVVKIETLVFEAEYNENILTLKFAGAEEVFDLETWTQYSSPFKIEAWGNKITLLIQDEKPIYAEVLICKGFYRFCVYMDYYNEQRISIVTTWKKIND